MKHRQTIDKLLKLLVTILGRQADEFGLLPDADGYIKIKDLMKVLAEEPGWRHVRLNQIREVIHLTHSQALEMQGNRIRAVDRSGLLPPEIPNALPKLLYYPVRQRAYPVIREKGLPAAASGNRIILADEIEMAQRLGRRIDSSPVILTVNSDNARQLGATVWRFGKQLFLSDCLPLGSFSGPPLPKKRLETKKVDPLQPPEAPKTPGSFFLDLSSGTASGEHYPKGRRERKNEWKRDRTRISRNKTKGWPDA
jgi:putative RNA 2'-phosphotransferase